MTDPMELVGRLEEINPHVTNDYIIGDALTEAAAYIREVVEWRPIETAPRDGTIIQRPHTTWGAMSVRHKRPDQSEEFLHGFSWMAADYSVLWPESAFLPFWLPIPPAPGAEA